MALSDQTLHNLANALKPEVIKYIQEDERYVEFMMELIPDAITSQLGTVKNDVLMDLSMIIMDKISLYTGRDLTS